MSTRSELPIRRPAPQVECATQQRRGQDRVGSLGAPRRLPGGALTEYDERAGAPLTQRVLTFLG
jgi:hypothetical protein